MFGREVQEGDLVCLRRGERTESPFTGILDARAPGHVRDYSISEKMFNDWHGNIAGPEWMGMRLLKRGEQEFPTPTHCRVTRLPLRAYRALYEIKRLHQPPWDFNPERGFDYRAMQQVIMNYAPWPEAIFQRMQELGSVHLFQVDALWLEVMFGGTTYNDSL